MQQYWPIRLFNKSVLKQRKYSEIVALLGPTAHLDCLDIGSDNGVISYLLRQRGGCWQSVDLDAQSVSAMHELLQSGVYRIDAQTLPFRDDQFDRVVIVDFLEHIPNDQAWIDELFRVVKPGGKVIINVPHSKNSLLRRFRLAIGQTDAKHGHVRPGYTLETLRAVLDRRFTLETYTTYSRFFSEWIDTLIVHAVYVLKKHRPGTTQKGAIVTGQDLHTYPKMFKLYSLMYPLVWIFAQLDRVIFFRSGYMLIARVQVNKAQDAVKHKGSPLYAI